MIIATLSETANLMGYKSRSSLYSFKKHGLLDDYLIEINGHDNLVLKPAGKQN